MNNLKKGLFITLEGIDGSGKSYQAKKIVEYFVSSGFEVAHTAEPGGTDVGRQIRNILTDKKNSISHFVEMLLFAADRRDHIEKVIKPALLSNKVIVCERFVDSSVVYQGFAGKIPVQTVVLINDIIREGIKPDVTFFLNVDIKKSLERKKIKDRMDSFDEEFYKKVIEGYLFLASKEKERIKIINANASKEKVFLDIKTILDKLLSSLNKT